MTTSWLCFIDTLVIDAGPPLSNGLNHVLLRALRGPLRASRIFKISIDLIRRLIILSDALQIFTARSDIHWSRKLTAGATRVWHIYMVSLVIHEGRLVTVQSILLLVRIVRPGALGRSIANSYASLLTGGDKWTVIDHGTIIDWIIGTAVGIRHLVGAFPAQCKGFIPRRLQLLWPSLPTSSYTGILLELSIGETV